MDKLEELRNKEPVILATRLLIEKEYDQLKRKSANYAELKKKCKHRCSEILYRDKNLGMFAKEMFEELMEEDLGNIRCLPDED